MAPATLSSLDGIHFVSVVNCRLEGRKNEYISPRVPDRNNFVLLLYDRKELRRMQRSGSRLQAITAQAGRSRSNMKHHLMIGTWYVQDTSTWNVLARCIPSKRQPYSHSHDPLRCQDIVPVPFITQPANAPRTPPGAIFTVAFDTSTHSLELIKRTEIPHDEPISWLTIDHSRKNLYGAGMKKWSSYAVHSPTDIRHHASLAMGGDPKANDATTKTRAIFVLAAKKAPFLVYGNPFYEHAGFINVHSVNSDGGLDRNVQNAELDANSAVHGMVFDAEEEYLYSADMWANKIWCHKKVIRTSAPPKTEARHYP